MASDGALQELLDVLNRSSRASGLQELLDVSAERTAASRSRWRAAAKRDRAERGAATERDVAATERDVAAAARRRFAAAERDVAAAARRDALPAVHGMVQRQCTVHRQCNELAAVRATVRDRAAAKDDWAAAAKDDWAAAEDDRPNPRGLRGEKQKRWRQLDSDSQEDEEDPRAFGECDCKLASQGARAHVKGDGCKFILGTRGICYCWCKWSSHTDECNEAYKALPDVEHVDRASWLAAGYGKRESAATAERDRAERRIEWDGWAGPPPGADFTPPTTDFDFAKSPPECRCDCYSEKGSDAEYADTDDDAKSTTRTESAATAEHDRAELVAERRIESAERALEAAERALAERDRGSAMRDLAAAEDDWAAAARDNWAAR